MGHIPKQVIKDALPLAKKGAPAMVANSLRPLLNKLVGNKGTTIAGRTVLITGASSGIGRLMAEECVRRGAKAVIVWDISPQRTDETVAHLEQMGATSKGYIVDLSQVEKVKEAAEQTLADFPVVDILVNCAGVVSGSSLLDLTDRQIDLTLDVNVRALFSVTREFLPGMMERNDGHIVTIASAAGTVGVPKMTDYCASKWAARGFMESLRLELVEEGSSIRTLVVCPFYINTGMFAGVKTRVPWLLPILDPPYVADNVIRCIENGEAELFLPAMVKFVGTLRAMPTRWGDWAARVLGISNNMDDFVGRSESFFKK